MKKLKIFLITITMLANIGGTALADGMESLKSTAGITPDSILYGVDKTLENIKLAITFSGKAKVEVLSSIAEERIAESQVMAESGREDLAQGAINAYSSNMTTANEILQQIIAQTEGEGIVGSSKEETTTEEETTTSDVQPIDTTEEVKDTAAENSTVEEAANSAETNVSQETNTEETTAPNNTAEEVSTNENPGIEENKSSENSTADESASTETTTEQNSTSEEKTSEEVSKEEIKVDEEKNQELKELEAKVVAKQEKAIEILKAVQEKVSDKTKETIASVIELQTAKKEAIIQMMEKRHEFNIVKKEVIEGIAKVEELKKTGNEESIKNAEDALKVSSEKLADSKKAFKEAFVSTKAINKEVKQLNKELKKDLHREVKEGNITKEEAKKALKAVETNNGDGQLKKIIKK
ncbi:DUF5667 domain-containing protein [Clostridium thermopalmarium]|uniref:DUF5667 domain-containing protein n=1 Tax=Clostridium thermopalmarium DSM 5974 TaxID=1121340 RepID=A0A2T0ARG7_9CLOT|nr:DUF5667 domain-containing protein [Clostridium thermopalmarium]PRR72100.1 hypothetical protein CPAL_15870 [Clostridium thermopalmarium DSM 5974]PVZ23752.1 hypothetical protein LX19_01463 [Clostridium thermopalmarium DSM 5974]